MPMGHNMLGLTGGNTDGKGKEGMDPRSIRNGMVTNLGSRTVSPPDKASMSAEDLALYDRIDASIEKYKDHEGALIMVLHEAQEAYGYLPEDVQYYIAGKMGVPLAEVSGVVSFYSFFTTKKRGKHTIRVCQGTACYVRGGKRLVEAIKTELGIDVGDTTEDGLFTFEIARCIGACGLAPAIMIDDDVYKQMTPQKLHILLRKYHEAERASEAEEPEEEGGIAS